MLRAERVESVRQVELLRRVRNAAAGGYTSFNGQVQPLEQQHWWQSMHGSIRAWLYYADPDLVGYGLVRREPDGTWWNSIGVCPAYRGHGWGCSITADVLNRHRGTLHSAVRRDNPAAVKMHHFLDWEEVSGPDDALLYLRSRGRA